MPTGWLTLLREREGGEGERELMERRMLQSFVALWYSNTSFEYWLKLVKSNFNFTILISRANINCWVCADYTSYIKHISKYEEWKYNKLIQYFSLKFFYISILLIIWDISIISSYIHDTWVVWRSWIIYSRLNIIAKIFDPCLV